MDWLGVCLGVLLAFPPLLPEPFNPAECLQEARGLFSLPSWQRDCWLNALLAGDLPAPDKLSQALVLV